jgi:hypothetical protein
MPDDTRERWLERGVEELRPVFAEAGVPLPERVRVSVGFPSRGGVGSRKRTIGQCWPKAAADDGVGQIFISPLLAEPVHVLDVLAHEALHAAVGTACGHRGAFVRGCKAIGLTNGKPTQASAGPELRARLEAIAESLGPYPHAALKAKGRVKKQTTRMLKASCACGYIIRLSRTWAERGLPTCHCGKRFALAA